MKPRRDVLVGDPPIREIRGGVDLIGPRGGVIYILTLSCGHWLSRRKLPDKTTAPCLGCLLEEAFKTRPGGS